MLRLPITLLFIILYSHTLLAYTPPVGSIARKSVMNAARIPIMKELAGQKIVFVVRKLKMLRGWAYLEAVPRLRNGKKVNYKITKFKDDIEQGFFDDWVGVLLRHNGHKWTVVTFVIGATDYPVVSWPEAYGAPTEIFH